MFKLPSLQHVTQQATNLIGKTKSTLLPDITIQQEVTTPTESSSLLGQTVTTVNNTLHNLLPTGGILGAPPQLIGKAKGLLPSITINSQSITPTGTTNVLGQTVTTVNNTLHNILPTGGILEGQTTLIEDGANQLIGKAKTLLPGITISHQSVTPTENSNLLGQTVTAVNNTLHNILPTGGILEESTTLLDGGATQLINKAKTLLPSVTISQDAVVPTETSNIFDKTVSTVNNTLHNILHNGQTVIEAPTTIIKGVVPTPNSNNVIDQTVSTIKTGVNNTIETGTDIIKKLLSPTTTMFNRNDQVTTKSITNTASYPFTNVFNKATSKIVEVTTEPVTETSLFESTTNSFINVETSTLIEPKTFTESILNTTRTINDAVSTTVHDAFGRPTFPVNEAVTESSLDITSKITEGIGGVTRTTHIINDVIDSRNNTSTIFTNKVTSAISTVTENILKDSTIGNDTSMKPQDETEIITYIIIGIVIGILILVGVVSCFIYKRRMHAKKFAVYQVSQLNEYSRSSE